MSVLDMWSVCDRCSFEYKRRFLRKETTGYVVCHSCFDGKFDRRNHPQNKPARSRLESRMVPDGRAPIDLSYYLAQEDLGALLQEDGGQILGSESVWTPSQSTYM
jgi:hypothetical protein